MTPLDFAKLAMAAQTVREESFIKAPDNTPRSEHEAYSLDQMQAAQKACLDHQIDLVWAYPIYLLNTLAWNDIQIWAEKQGA